MKVYHWYQQQERRKRTEVNDTVKLGDVYIGLDILKLDLYSSLSRYILL